MDKYKELMKKASVSLRGTQRAMDNDRPYAALAMAEILVQRLQDACIERDEQVNS